MNRSEPLHPVDPPPATRRRGIGFYFWGTIFTLIGITVVLVILAMFRPLPQQAPPAQISITQEQLTQVEGRARQAGLAAVDAHLDDAMELMFDPVHAAIPAYADFHYSVWGQYAELLAAGAETLGIEEKVGSIMRQRLFTGFEDRHIQQMARLQEVYEHAVRDQFRAEGERLVGESGQSLSDAARLALDGAQRRMIVTLPTAITAATGSAAATVAVLAIVKPIAKKVVAATAAKAAAKGVGKAAGIGGSAAAGATAGSLLGPVGTAVGGVGGAVIGWLAVDYAVVKLDEYFNRDEFEAELRDAIDVEKTRLRATILAGYAATQP